MVPHHLTPQTMTLLLQLIIHPMLHQQHMAPRLKHLLHQLLLLPMLHQLHHTQPWLTLILDNLSPYVDPMEAPPDANIHHMLWRYVYKMCGTPQGQNGVQWVLQAGYYHPWPHLCQLPLLRQ